MSANLGLLVVIGLLYSAGVYLLVERSLTRVLLGVLLLGNATNLLLLTAGGPGGEPPLVGRFPDAAFADPLAQAMILTAIVITMGLAAFMLALSYRAWSLLSADAIRDDPEDVTLARRTAADAPDRDRSDDPASGADTPAGDRFGATLTKDRLDEVPPGADPLEDTERPARDDDSATTSSGEVL